MTASETISFTHFLPLMIGDLIPLKNPDWQQFLFLLMIIVGKLINAVQKHHIAYIELYGALKPKQQILEHFASIIKRSGATISHPQYELKVESGHSHTIRIKIFQIINGSSRLIRRIFFLSKRTQEILKNSEYFKKVINIHNIDSNIKTCILFNELEHKGTKYKLSYYVITQN